MGQNNFNKGGFSNAAQVARREACIQQILILLARRPMTVAEVAAELAIPVNTAYGYLRHMADAGQARRADEIGPKNQQLWVLGLETKGPLVRKEASAFRGPVIVPARQVGMQRHWLDVALFGPAREGHA
jgi:hypothetical protein